MHALTQQLHPLIQALAQGIVSLWQEAFPLAPYPLPADLGLVEGHLEGEKLWISNQCYQAPPFRKLHLELARAGAGLDILHCVMFPDPHFDLPLFGCDLVGGRGQISAAIVDLSPVRGSLPPAYGVVLSGWEERRRGFQQPRPLPPWGEIFSPYCLFIRPQGEQEEQAFLELLLDYLRLHIRLALQADKIRDPQIVAEIWAGQERYCKQQQQNDRTRRVLEKAFDPAWAERYMTTVLFDLPPQGITAEF